VEFSLPSHRYDGAICMGQELVQQDGFYKVRIPANVIDPGKTYVTASIKAVSGLDHHLSFLYFFFCLFLLIVSKHFPLWSCLFLCI
jgi:hypothetical protein